MKVGATGGYMLQTTYDDARGHVFSHGDLTLLQTT
jgi:hypothetical protein